MKKEIKIKVPEGYEIDKEKSTFEKIVFKKKKEAINCWEDIKQTLKGVWITELSDIQSYSGVAPCGTNRNIFSQQKYAKSALASAQISQLLPHYDSNVNWNDDNVKWVIKRAEDEIDIDSSYKIWYLLAFNTKKEAERFLKYNEQLVIDYFML